MVSCLFVILNEVKNLFGRPMVAPTAFFTLIEHYKSIVILSGSEESFRAADCRPYDVLDDIA